MRILDTVKERVGRKGGIMRSGRIRSQYFDLGCN